MKSQQELESELRGPSGYHVAQAGCRHPEAGPPPGNTEWEEEDI